MRHESDDGSLVVVNSASGVARWAPLAIVLAVVGGFISLSWYAYHAGMQSVKEEDLLVVEADKTPMKEKPADPGGMQFPNQDKTVFETFAGNSHQPPKVERVLPVPEEPIAKDTDSETSTWINDKLAKSGAKGAEQVIGKDIVKKLEDPAPAAVKTQPEEENKPDAKKTGAEPDHQVIAAQHPVVEESVTYVAPKKHSQAAAAQVLDSAVMATDKHGQPFAPEKIPSAKAEKPRDTPKVEKTVAHEVAKVETPKPVRKAASGSASVQLGAYRSETEATEAWEKMHLKQKLLSDKSPVIIKADLGSKGIYYRLRVGGLGSTEEAKSLCAGLSAKGQPCILPTDK